MRGWWRRGAAVLFSLFGLALLGDGLALKTKAVLAQILLDRAWAHTVQGQAEVRPWPSADTWPIAKLEMPKLGESVIILHGASGQALAFGPAWVRQSAPLGTPGVTVIAAHRDTHFRFLRRVARGDVIQVTDKKGHVWRFNVSQTRIINASETKLVVEADRPRLALVTCWPFDAVRPGPDRFVVVADLTLDHSLTNRLAAASRSASASKR